MSTRSSATSTRRASRPPAARRRLVLCVRNDGYQVSLDRGKFYIALADREAESEGQLRVIDESGEDYLYPKSLFATVALPTAVRRLLLAAA
jgi:hypothetical protein